MLYSPAPPRPRKPVETCGRVILPSEPLKTGEMVSPIGQFAQMRISPTTPRSGGAASCRPVPRPQRIRSMPSLKTQFLSTCNLQPAPCNLAPVAASNRLCQSRVPPFRKKCIEMNILVYRPLPDDDLSMGTRIGVNRSKYMKAPQKSQPQALPLSPTTESGGYDQTPIQLHSRFHQG